MLNFSVFSINYENEVKCRQGVIRQSLMLCFQLFGANPEYEAQWKWLSV